eukprot:2094583-Rhodomonas_salina.2
MSTLRWRPATGQMMLAKRLSEYSFLPATGKILTYQTVHGMYTSGTGFFALTSLHAHQTQYQTWLPELLEKKSRRKQGTGMRPPTKIARNGFPFSELEQGVGEEGTVQEGPCFRERQGPAKKPMTASCKAR